MRMEKEERVLRNRPKKQEGMGESNNGSDMAGRYG